MNPALFRFFLGLCLFLYGASAIAKPMNHAALPPELQPWVNWVLWDQEQRQCPAVYSQTNQRNCAWPGKLSLRVRPTQGSFEHTWQLYDDRWVPLPGDATHWPQQVTADGNSISVLSKNDRPHVYLSRGTHTLSGRLHWPHIPERIQLPAHTGWVDLTVEGNTIEAPQWDKRGQLWIKKQSVAEDVTDHIILKVHRRLVDNIPFQMFTTIDLQVSGRSREVTLGKVFSDAFTPIMSNSNIPARLDERGHLVVQVRAGKWQVQLMAYQHQPVTAITRHAPEGEWPDMEIWGFQAQHPLRLVRLSGLPQINAQDLALPNNMTKLPIFQAAVGQQLSFEQTQRGDPGLTSDTFDLVRHWYLDFDGQGYTIQDTIQGTSQRERRLDMPAPTQLGQVVLNGQPQFITQLEDNGMQGIEVRKGRVQLSADSRYQGQRSPLPAVGWHTDMQSVKGTLHLPPGWRVIAISGVDAAPQVWVERWTLLDIFMVLVIAVAVGRLWHWSWGLLALFTLALIYHESDAPRWIWVYVLAAVALFRAMPEGRGKHWMARIRNVLFLSLALITLVFTISQARQGLHPQLEHPWNAMDNSYQPLSTLTQAEQDYTPNSWSSRAGKSKPKRRKVVPTQLFDPKAKIQTGPGLPQWHWNRIDLRWSGVVDRNQEIQVYYVPPQVNAVLNFVRIFAVMVLFLLIVGVIRVKPTLANVSKATPLLLLISVFMWPMNADANPPSAQRLAELKQRLLAPVLCETQCASIANLHLRADPDYLQFRFEAHSVGRTSIPLPRIIDWQANSITRDKTAVTALQRDEHGVQWMVLTSGTQVISMRGRMPTKERIQITFPLAPKRLTTQISGWTLKGVQQGQALSQIELERTRSDQSEAIVNASLLPAFVEVQRTLLFGISSPLEWEVETHVRRLSQLQQPILLAIPLLEGESVTTDQVWVKDHRVQVSLSPGQTDMRWRSALQKHSDITLTAPQKQPWVEVWRVRLSPLWHAQFSTLPRIAETSTNALVWRPWPGEALNIVLSRPSGIEGDTLTIDEVNLRIEPGIRHTRIQADVTIRSSLGGEHVITLPEGMTLHTLSIDHRNQPITQNRGAINLPIHPGKQTVNLTLSLAQGMHSYFETPDLNVGGQGVNARIEVIVPQDRWVLWVNGPTFGPAVLFWGVMFVLILVSIGFGRIKGLPLKTWQWILLWIGLSMASMESAVVIVLWFFAMMARKTHKDYHWWHFNLLQIGLAIWTIIAMFSLIYCVKTGLLGSPDMSIVGNGSYSGALKWYQDRFDLHLPTASVISLPMIVYRIIMLLWASWLAWALLNWLKWSWSCYSAGTLWMPKPKKATAEPVTAPPANQLEAPTPAPTPKT